MKRFASIFTAFIISASVALGSSGIASAQSSAALSITPRKNYTVEAGKTVRDTLNIRNMDSERTLSLNLNIVDFSFKDDGGTPDLMLAEDAPQTAWSIKPFVKLSAKTLSIKPRESKTVDVSYTVPKGQGAGSYYSAIVYSSGTPEGGNVGLSASGVTLAFVTVPGTVKQDLQLEKFGAYRAKAGDRAAKYLNFAIDKPQNIAYTLKNEGNVAESPTGTITLRHMFGQEIKINDINPQSSLALRGQTRTFVSCIAIKDEHLELSGTERSNAKVCTDPGLWPGLYTASIDAYYGQNGNPTKEITGTTWFIYAPLWFLILLGILILAIAFAIWRIVSKTKNKKRSVKGKKSALRR
ncbi:hypothetical protein KI440_00435 [Candidatus Saccharibacteria bacterium TM7i]|nr:hypothetical protein KI440_00435 [Candidatus Saccharibacteria bacterium TM7i]